MDKITLKLESRSERGKANKALRAAGSTPVVTYSHGGEAQSLKANSRELAKAYSAAGGNKIIAIKIDDARSKNAIFHDVTLDSLTGAILHADLLAVRMDEKIKAEVPLKIIGESTAVYQDEGTLVTPLDAIEVEALPGDLPPAIEVDISGLDDFEKSLHVKDLVVPAGVEVLTEADDLVAKVDPPRSEAEMEALDEDIVQELPEGAAEAGAEGETSEDGGDGEKSAADSGE